MNESGEGLLFLASLFIPLCVAVFLFYKSIQQSKGERLISTVKLHVFCIIIFSFTVFAFYFFDFDFMHPVLFLDEKYDGSVFVFILFVLYFLVINFGLSTITALTVNKMLNLRYTKKSIIFSSGAWSSQGIYGLVFLGIIIHGAR